MWLLDLGSWQDVAVTLVAFAAAAALVRPFVALARGRSAQGGTCASCAAACAKPSGPSIDAGTATVVSISSVRRHLPADGRRATTDQPAD